MTMPADLRALIVEDEAVLARAVGQRLEREGYRCRRAESLAEARRALDGPVPPDLVLLDMRLPDGSGLDLLAEIPPADHQRMAVIVMTAFGDIDNAVAAMKKGAADYLRKPVDLEAVVLAAERAVTAVRVRNRLAYSLEREHHRIEAPGLIGESPEMSAARQRLTTIASLVGDGSAPPPTVLILGETGTGKDVAARLIHSQGPLANRPFVHVDCAALPGELIEAELFGHAPGAYTGARGARSGLIEAAEDGTLFLDEIGELPLELQTKLLNVIERRVVRRIGANRETPVAARMIAATNRDLPAMITEGRFRSDLYYRLNVLTVDMPALRDCTGDAVILAKHFLAMTARRYGRPQPRLSADAVADLEAYPWPGNVRELSHLIERSVLLSEDNAISAATLALSVPAGQDQAETDTLKALRQMTLDEAERWLITETLKDTKGNVSRAARRLGVTRMAMRYRIQKYGLTPHRHKERIG